MGRRSGGAKLADELAARAMSYAEQQIEVVELAELELDALGLSPVDRALVHAALAKLGTANMQIITNAMARAFVHGYAAKLDDARPVEALGGIAESARRRGRRG